MYKRVLLLHQKPDGEDGARTVMEVIWNSEVCEAFVRLSSVYENTIHMMLNHEEIEGWSKNWGEAETYYQ